MKKTFLLSVLLMSVSMLQNSAFAQLQNKWSKKFGGTGSENITALATDNSRNLYATGYFTTNIQADTFQLFATDSRDIVLLKLNTYTRETEWAKVIGGKGEDEGTNITTDPFGNIYVCGNFSDTTFFDTTPVISAGQQDIFLAKYNTSGSLVWVRNVGGTGNDRAYNLKADKQGKVFLLAAFQDSLRLTPGPLNYHGSQGASDILLAKYDSAGSVLWSKSFGSTGADYAPALAVDISGNSYVGANVFGTGVSFMDGMPLMIQTQDSADAMIVKYSDAGVLQWTKLIVGNGAETINGLTIREDDVFNTRNILAAGSFTDSLRVGNDRFLSFGSTDAFVTEYTASSANDVRAQQIGDSGSDYATNVAFQPNSDYFVIGNFSGYIRLNQRLITSNTHDMFLAVGGSSYFWDIAQTDISSDTVLAFGLAIDSSGFMYTSGAFKGQLNTGWVSSPLLTATSATDGFILWHERLVTGLDEPTQKSSFTIFPNPAKDQLTISASENLVWEKRLLSIFSLTGQMVWQTEVHAAPQVSITLPKLSKGMYLLQLQSGQEVQQQKLMID